MQIVSLCDYRKFISKYTIITKSCRYFVRLCTWKSIVQLMWSWSSAGNIPSCGTVRRGATCISVLDIHESETSRIAQTIIPETRGTKLPSLHFIPFIFHTHTENINNGKYRHREYYWSKNSLIKLLIRKLYFSGQFFESPDFSSNKIFQPPHFHTTVFWVATIFKLPLTDRQNTHMALKACGLSKAVVSIKRWN